MTADLSWEDLAAGLPTHAGEVMTAHQGAPSIAEQSATHGAPLPEPNLGEDDAAKYMT